MKKSKKKILIAILCMVLNIILFSQLCFGSVSAFYDAVISLTTSDEQLPQAFEIQHTCEEDSEEELQPMMAPANKCSYGSGTGYVGPMNTQKGQDGSILGYYQTTTFSDGSSTTCYYNANGVYISFSTQCSYSVTNCSGGVCH